MCFLAIEIVELLLRVSVLPAAGNQQSNPILRVGKYNINSKVDSKVNVCHLQPLKFITLLTVQAFIL